ncbi:MAG: DUF1460 domain-containing protein [Candidatus Omnitrophica bacterium]|nr:DUF1460 domain-containing protein [Candidatus Omnitrophota bacterium]MBU4346406.1 DUF1460 domain-containing protein [Candidatus Omnitrophota bacterium]MBU4473635.1 DUF1460 domain-containing protein [Candidatus Omnitrophota bacterium]
MVKYRKDRKIIKISYIALAIVFIFLSWTAISLAEVDFNKLNLLADDKFLQKVKIYELNSVQLDLLLHELQRRFPDKDDRLKAIATMYLGADYYKEPFIDELKDPLPYSRTNCTMFVLYATTFLNSSNYEEALETIRWVHYKGGVVGYKNRYHFTSDRITDPDNKYFTDVTTNYVVDQSFIRELTLTLNVKQDGSLLFEGKLGGWKKTITIKYIKRGDFTIDKLKKLPRSIGIAFVKKSNWPIGVIIGHEGILIDGDLYHSSCPTLGLYKIEDYLSESFPFSDWEGMMLFEINVINNKNTE